jgi:hypothetical protein
VSQKDKILEWYYSNSSLSFLFLLVHFKFGFENYSDCEDTSCEHLQIYFNIFCYLEFNFFKISSMVAYKVWDHTIFSPALWCARIGRSPEPPSFLAPISQKWSTLYVAFAFPHPSLTFSLLTLNSSLISPLYYHNYCSLTHVLYIKKMHLDEVNLFWLSILSFVWCNLQFHLKAIWLNFVKIIAHGPPFKISFGE